MLGAFRPAPLDVPALLGRLDLGAGLLGGSLGGGDLIPGLGKLAPHLFGRGLGIGCLSDRGKGIASDLVHPGFRLFGSPISCRQLLPKGRKGGFQHPGTANGRGDVRSDVWGYVRPDVRAAVWPALLCPHQGDIRPDAALVVCLTPPTVTPHQSLGAVPTDPAQISDLAVG